jgi:chromosome partitioning protein
MAGVTGNLKVMSETDYTAVAFFNNKGGVGKTSLVYNLGHMLAEQGHDTLLVDLDPQSNLTAYCYSEDQLENIFQAGDTASIYNALDNLIAGRGGLGEVKPYKLREHLALVSGSPFLVRFEQQLAEAWSQCFGVGQERALRITLAFSHIIRQAAYSLGSEIVLIDVGPHLGAINRSALIAANGVVVPVAPDMFSALGLRMLGPALNDWRGNWENILNTNRHRQGQAFFMPAGQMHPIGYVMSRFLVRGGGLVQAFQRWEEAIEKIYGDMVDEQSGCLAKLQDFAGLMPTAHTQRVPLWEVDHPNHDLRERTRTQHEKLCDEFLRKLPDVQQ